MSSINHFYIVFSVLFFLLPCVHMCGVVIVWVHKNALVFVQYQTMPVYLLIEEKKDFYFGCGCWKIRNHRCRFCVLQIVDFSSFEQHAYESAASSTSDIYHSRFNRQFDQYKEKNSTENLLNERNHLKKYSRIDWIFLKMISFYQIDNIHESLNSQSVKTYFISLFDCQLSIGIGTYSLLIFKWKHMSLCSKWYSSFFSCIDKVEAIDCIYVRE